MSDKTSQEPWRTIAWDTYFTTVVGMSLHPGYTKEGSRRLSIEECAQMADQMMSERDKRK